MRHFRKHARRYSPVAATMLAVFLQACTHWTPMPLEPAKLPAPSQVRVTLLTGQQVIVKSPVIAGDTLRDASTDGVRWAQRRPRSGIPLAQISKLEVQRVDGAATAGLIVLTGVVVGAITLLAILKSIEVPEGCFILGCN